ncbi:MAG: hypothetical protein IJ003_02985 [Candidatus Gastranaerophilales bacterium]|nr:hypothetical protein [Candidatus Gastranaerophilales bacterium]
MNKKIYITLALTISLGVFCGTYNKTYSANTPVVKKPQQSVQANKTINTTSLNIVANPHKYLNKTIKMQATFDKFSTLGLDYSKALRESSKYIGILIQRDDVLDHNIPLSEMKLFMKKELAEKHIDLDTGDKIEITATVFSTALNDPWLDIKNLTVIKKAKKEENK